MLIGDEAFYRSVTRLVYGRADPAPGNFEPRYGTTAEFETIVREEAGRDMTWFFDAYVRRAELPVLGSSRDGERLSLQWTGEAPFPMPVEVEVNGEVQTVPMTDGRGEVTLPPNSHVLIDPDNKVLRRLDFVEEWKASKGG